MEKELANIYVEIRRLVLLDELWSANATFILARNADDYGAASMAADGIGYLSSILPLSPAGRVPQILTRMVEALKSSNDAAVADIDQRYAGKE